MSMTRRSPARLALLLGAILLAACGKTSSELARGYERDLRAMKQDGYGRADTRPLDAAWTAEDLERNFAHVVHARDHGRFGEQPLRKWRSPGLYKVVSMGAGPQADERAHMRDLARRLSAATGLPVREAADDEVASIVILYLDYEERAAMLRVPDLETDNPVLHELIEALQEDENRLCVYNTLHDAEDPEQWVTLAYTVIRSELPKEWRNSCLDEEVTQMFGPAFDHDDVRPSMFNDDEEFLFLTDHDEAMLRLIYDPRLRSGMTEAQTAPIVREILAEGGYGRGS